MTEDKIPLFPLPTHILPGGRLPLRIFDPRYLKMISKACANNSEFGIVMVAAIEKTEYGHILPIGTRVAVVDFDDLGNGLLGITVEGKEKFKLLSIDLDPDGLKIGTITPIPNWPDETISDDSQLIATKLAEVYDEYPELNKLYTTKYLTNLSWVCQRWLEILPVSVNEKQSLIAELNCHEVTKLLCQIITN